MQITPKEKAIEIVNGLIPFANYHPDNSSMRRTQEQLDNAKSSAHVVIDSILNTLDADDYYDAPFFEFWTEVKKEIDKI